MVEFDAVIIPVDGSESADRAAAVGARLAAVIQCPVTLLFVVSAAPATLISMGKLTAEEVKKIEQNAAREALEQARAAMGDAGASAEDQILLGDPAEEIITYLDRHPNALVVMGRRGLSRIQSLVLGSVSDKIVRHAKGAVTLVP